MHIYTVQPTAITLLYNTAQFVTTANSSSFNATSLNTIYTTVSRTSSLCSTTCCYPDHIIRMAFEGHLWANFFSWNKVTGPLRLEPLAPHQSCHIDAKYKVKRVFVYILKHAVIQSIYYGQTLLLLTRVHTDGWITGNLGQSSISIVTNTAQREMRLYPFIDS